VARRGPPGRCRPDATLLWLTSYSVDGAENEPGPEVQRGQGDPFVVSVHPVLVLLVHREREQAVRLHTELPEPRAVGRTGAHVGNGHHLRGELLHCCRNRREHRR